MVSHKIVIFCSYSHKDEVYREKLDTHLSMMKRQGLIELWHDRKITAGDEWKGQIDENLDIANVILLLMTANFLASDYCNDVEMKRAMERHESGEARVIPIMLTPFEGWKHSPLAKLQGLPKDAKPVTKWDDENDAFVNVAEGIRKAIESISPAKAVAPEQTKTNQVNNVITITRNLSESKLHISQDRTSIENQLPSLEGTIISVDPFKTYDNIDEIILLYDDKFQIDEEVDRFKETKIKAAFELYKVTKKTLKGVDSYYFLHLLGGITIKNTFTKFREKHSNVDKNDLIILLPKEKGQIDHQKRLSNIDEMFKPNKIFYISDFIWEECTNQGFKEELEPYEIPEFVDPHIKSTTSTELTALEYITNWIDRDNSSILLITGSGGIGKTTIARRAANEFIQKKSKKVLFIDSTTIISYLSESIESLDGVCDVYTFYRAYCESQGYKMDDSKFLSKDLFRANLDNGNIAIILDGLDEVISRFGNSFDLDSFFYSIDDYCASAKLGKVIISCRNQFLEGREFKTIEEIEILPFDIILAKKYFSKIFPSLPKTADKGIPLANYFTKNNTEYIPFILDVVVSILRDKIENEGQFSDPSFDSEILSEKIENDYIIYRICKREEKRYSTSLTTDQQIKFFVSLASKYDGCINNDKIAELLKTILDVEDGIYREALIAHPILAFHKDIITFKYDFFKEYFKGILISYLLIGKEEMNAEIIKILGSSYRFNSSFIKTCCDRLSEEYKDDYFNILIINLIAKIRKFNKNKDSLYEREKAISGAFLIALYKLTSKTKESYTELLKDIFLDNNEINGFCFYGVNDKITFDFSSLRFTNIFISEYDFFWECTFNEKTYFRNSFFSSLNLRDGIRTFASRINFDLETCKIDKTIDKALLEQGNEEKSRKVNLGDDISRFLKLFYSEGRMKPQKESVLKAKYRGKNDYNSLIKLLTKYFLIEEHISHKTKKMKSE
jgi:flagellar biosynthesis GTPase FlhF